MRTATISTPLGLSMNHELQKEFPAILNSAAMDFIIALHEKFNHKRKSLLKESLDGDKFMAIHTPESVSVKDWTVTDVPVTLFNLRSTIKVKASNAKKLSDLSFNASQYQFQLNSTSCEENCVEHQALFDLIREDDSIGCFLFEPRGIVEQEVNILIHEDQASAALYDFGLYFFNNVYELIRNEKCPCFTIKDISNVEEAKWWNNVFAYAQSYLGLPNNTIKVQVNMSSLSALKNIDKILFELRNHLIGTCFELRSYLESHVQTYFQRAAMTLPNLDQISVRSSFLEGVLDLIVHSSHIRNIPCIINNFVTENNIGSNQPDYEYLFEKGFDGICLNNQNDLSLVNDTFVNQVNNKRNDVSFNPIELEKVPTGTVTEMGVKKCLETFKADIGEISLLASDKSLEGLILKQWINHNTKTVSGKTINFNYCISTY